MNSRANEHSQIVRTLKGEKAKLSEKGITSIVCSSIIMGALYRPQKVKGRPSDLTLEKTSQKS